VNHNPVEMLKIRPTRGRRPSAQKTCRLWLVREYRPEWTWTWARVRRSCAN